MLFVEFMQQALYHPLYGYYTGNLTKLGREGDFMTSPELTPLFGQTLARGCVGFFEEMTRPMLFEFGAGTGKLCVDLLKSLEALKALPEKYIILEVSGHLRQVQEQWITEQIPHLSERIEWISQWPKEPFDGVIIANEVLDAMPVHRLKQEGGTVYESVIVREETGELTEAWQRCDNERLIKYAEAYFPGEDIPYVSEVNGLIEGWLSGCVQMLNRGAVFLIDYGFPAREYYHLDRSSGTLMCHYQHHAHPNPLIHVGEQDITAHVNFSHVAEAADSLGFHVALYTNQAAFLLALGLLDCLTAMASEREKFKANQAVKMLLHPSEMGELFKVMVLTKAWDAPLPWHVRQDKRASL